MIGRVNLLTLNESEARHLTGEGNLLAAARELLSLGPQYVLIKKGEHGSILFSLEHICLMPAFPLETVLDPYVTILPPYYLYYPEQNRRLELLRLFSDFLASKREGHAVAFP